MTDPIKVEGPKPLRIIICGGRDYEDYNALRRYMDKFHWNTPVGEVIQGGARGADTIASAWALTRGIPCTEVVADWESHGKAAGVIRNRAMADLRPDAVVAFPGGKGTAMMVNLARRRGVRVYEVCP